jgi:hypothetical protein
MTLNRTRAILDDCRHLLAELRQNPREGSWRTRWFAAVVMLRAVGHVLEHETKNSADVALRAAAQRWWKNLKESEPEPAIFWQFIYDDRNALLKEYSFTATQSPRALARSEGPAGGSSAKGIFVFRPLGVEIFDETPSYQMVLSPFTGRDARDVVDEAIQWWDGQLQAIESGTAWAGASPESVTAPLS